MGRKYNAELGTVDVKIRIYTDGDGDVMADVVELIGRPNLSTENLEYLNDRGFYGDSQNLDGELFDKLGEVLQKRPNRAVKA